MDNIHKILIRYWGHAAFRPLQEEIINSIIDGNDTLALLPTGGGKSVCFQVPALAMDGLCLVISPLIALMKDQVEGLKNKNIKAEAVYSGMPKREIDRILDNAVYGDLKFLYLSPERLQTELFRERAKKMKFSFFAIDEAHCISQWGYDFRPQYLKIPEIRETNPTVPVIALTATATPEVVDDIQDKLKFKKSKKVFQKSFARDNLIYYVVNDENKNDRLLRIFSRITGTAVIYVRNRRQTVEIATFLQRNKINADYYHAGIEQKERSGKQDSWIKGNTRVMVATNAFGMGIDKSNVRLVVHLDLPDSPEAYFQEAGRGGRDGEKSYAILLHENADVKKLKVNFDAAWPDPDEIKKVYNSIGNYYNLAVGAGENTTHNFDIHDFISKFSFPFLNVYYSVKILEKEGYFVLTDSFYEPSKLFIPLKKEELYRFQVKNKGYDSFIRLILRSYTGLFTGFVKIDEGVIGKRAGIKPQMVKQWLEKLHNAEIFNYIKAKDKPQLFYSLPRQDPKTINLSDQFYHKQKEWAQNRINVMINYATSTAKCRSIILLEYFGEKDAKRCGQCDVCLRRNKMNLSKYEFDRVTQKIKPELLKTPLTVNQLLSKFNDLEEEKVVKVIEWLLDNEKIFYFGEKLVWNKKS